MWYKCKRIGLKGKLDRLFSEYIRRRDADAGYCRCVTCGKLQHWREMDLSLIHISEPTRPY